MEADADTDITDSAMMSLCCHYISAAGTLADSSEGSPAASAVKHSRQSHVRKLCNKDDVGRPNNETNDLTLCRNVRRDEDKEEKKWKK